MLVIIPLKWESSYFCQRWAVYFLYFLSSAFVVLQEVSFYYIFKDILTLFQLNALDVHCSFVLDYNPGEITHSMLSLGPFVKLKR